ncbi:helix-turn-helix domain-containing protein [Aliidiomarina haloalkalitolerans]|uniref:Transcriptional regulator n=1 Tax=Aliidiomarina haloalkalitolerans TaxID=859059 RepID=A0A432VVQ9_9GAMM|nr:transcriptional regulator [Aliidiomarina haloalkalitolerans]RUO20635.1 transcriptional regulator [Aliidiomarina haloalkalitolerans]
MLVVAEVSKLAKTIMANVPLLAGISNDKEYEEALELVEDLLDNYDANLVVIEALSNVIERYEDESLRFETFNLRQAGLDPAVETLKVLMDQNGLNTTDFENEIGKKSMVSQVLTGKKNLTRAHITKLAERFGVAPAIFF